MSIKQSIRRADTRYTGGRVRRWFVRNFVLGGRWGEYIGWIDAVPAGATVLDLGAGEAELRARMPQARYIAIDRGVGHAGWDYSALDVVADATAIPLASNTIDVIVCKQVLEHISEPVALLTDAARVLKPGGRILLSTNQAWPQHQQPYDFFRYTSFGLRYCFEKAGLEVERIEAMGGVFTCSFFHFTQTLSPHLWARSSRGRKVVSIITKPIAWLFRLVVPIVTALDRLDKTKDNTLGWYVLGVAPRD